jgi:hypothetical protein
MTEKYLIWWTNQNDCERIVPLETWPVYLYDEYRSRYGRSGRGRLWSPSKFDHDKDLPEGVVAAWDEDNNWLCKAASDAGGIVIEAKDVAQVQFLPGFVTTFAMALPLN